MNRQRGPLKQFWGELPGRMKKVFLMVGIVSLFLDSSINVYAQCDQCTIQYNDGIPEDIRIYCEQVGAAFGICPELLESIAYYESRFIPTVKNGSYYGLMQVDAEIHEFRLLKYELTLDDLYDPYYNLIIAADYLKELFDTYGDDDPIVLMYYTGSTKSLNRYKEYGFMPKCVERVLDRSAYYERLHNK